MGKIAFQRGAPGKRPRFAVWDFETEGLGGRLLACSYMIEGDAEPSYINSGNIIQTIFDVMCANNDCHWFAHNAQYEFRYFIDLFKSIADRVSIFNRTDTEIYMIKVQLPEYGEKAALVMRDSMALYSESLRNFARNFAPDLQKLSFDFEATKFDQYNPDHIEYSKRDSESLLASLIKFDSLIYDVFDVHVRATTASTAMAAWERSLPKNCYFKPTEMEEKFIRDAYFGGLVFLTDTRVFRNCKTYDINSSYPYQMKTHEFPIGAPLLAKRFYPGILGIYDVTISAPDNLIVPIIPYRKEKFVLWPSGTFRTKITSIEIEFALSQGYRLHEVHRGLVWNKTGNPFREFVLKCERLRKEHKGTPLEKVVKLIQNSLYGKFGANKIRRKFYLTLPDGDVSNLIMWGDYFVRTEKAEMLTMPQWAVFVTAYARLHLLRTVYEAGLVNCLYGDTDSLTVKENVEITTGAEYGDYKLEKKWREFRALAPKSYSGILDDGTYAGAAKGLPRGREGQLWKENSVIEKLHNGEIVLLSYNRLEKFATSLKTGYISTHEMSRRSTNIENSKNWTKTSEGRIVPRRVDSG